MRKKSLYAVSIGVLSAIIVLLLWRGHLLDRMEAVTWSWRVTHFAKASPVSKQIKIILLDQASLDWGQEANGLSWPWPREVYGPIINFCKRGGAKAIAFDVLYTEPSSYGVHDDIALGMAEQLAGMFVGAVFLGEETGMTTNWPENIAPNPIRLEGLESWLQDISGRVVLPRAAFPVPEVATNALWLANVRGEPDADGVIRRAALFRIFDGKVVPALGLAPLFAEASQEHPASARINSHFFSWGQAAIPVDAQGRIILNYRGAVSIYEPYSAAAIIQSELRLLAGDKTTVNPDEFRDAYVFFGFSAPGLLDLRPTPVSSVSPGVMVYATMLDNLLMQDPIRAAPVFGVILIVCLTALACSLIVILTRHVWQSVLAGVVFLLGSVAFSFAAYALGMWYPMVTQVGAILLTLMVALIFNYATEGRQKAFIKKAFRHYLSPVVIDKLLEHPDQLKLGGERRELTIFFSDLQGFSGISEKLEPQELTTLLNDYLTDMTHIIMEEGGMVDKYEGDAIIAFWNAPLNQKDHAVRACHAVLRCQRKLAERRKEFEERTGALLYQRIGLNTGEVVVGNMGSTNRFDYTVLGDAANLASRLEGANKAFGTYIMISESAWSKAKSEFIGRETGLIRVVGRKTPVRVYELLGLADEKCDTNIAKFEEALHLCQKKQGAKALEILRDFDDVVARKYITHLEKTDPAQWDGIWNLTEK